MRELQGAADRLPLSRKHVIRRIADCLDKIATAFFEILARRVKRVSR
jgi:hypothetical protein